MSSDGATDLPDVETMTYEQARDELVRVVGRLEAGGEPAGPDVVQECGAGLVTIRRTPRPDGAGPRLAFAAPPLVRAIFRLPQKDRPVRRKQRSSKKEVAA